MSSSISQTIRKFYIYGGSKLLLETVKLLTLSGKPAVRMEDFFPDQTSSAHLAARQATPTKIQTFTKQTIMILLFKFKFLCA